MCIKDLVYLLSHHRQPERTMFGFGLQTTCSEVIWSKYTRIISVLSDAK